jgi:hypothetical protein
MAFLLGRKNIAHGKPQQADRLRHRTAVALPSPLASRYGLARRRVTPAVGSDFNAAIGSDTAWSEDGRSAGDDRLR